MVSFSVGGNPPDLPALVAVSRPGSQLQVPPAVADGIARSRQVVTAAVRSGATIYGINTGFGKLAGVRIPGDRLGQLQRNLILSHATGVGAPLPVDVCRLAFALRVHNLCLGSSGVRPELIDTMVALFNGGFTPVLPSQGSVGASGDLAPLAHMALPLLGEGICTGGDGEEVPGAVALSRVGRAPVELAEKEGLALINGTQIMTAIGLLTLHRALLLSKTADIACAATIEALRGSARPFDPRVHAVRPHPGQVRTAENIRRLLEDSAVLSSHANCDKVQDAYSMRCAPQVHGAAKGGLTYARDVLMVEAHSVTDNPLVFADGDVVSAGNFHGQPVSQAMDVLKIAVSTLANISERRIENLVNPDISGLPAFLAHDPGVESGFMIPQVVAAALASENKTLAHPASVDTIPTSANREDHVSMGVTAARHSALVVENTTQVLGIELLCACQGLDLGADLLPGKGVVAAYREVREKVATLDRDRFLAPDLAAAGDLVRNGELILAVERKIGVLHGA